MAGLERRPGPPAELGMYRLRGDLSALAGGPGRRTVRQLEIREARGSADALEALAAFPDLRVLDLGDADGLALAPLASLRLERLLIAMGRNLDLAPLAEFDGLRVLRLSSLDRCAVPAPLRLPASLRALNVVGDERLVPSAVVEELVAHIDWPGLADLRELDLGMRGGAPGRMARVDLGFLRVLPPLERLEMPHGVLHVGEEPSPLDPPFTGLSRHLNWCRFETALDPQEVTTALARYLGPGGEDAIAVHALPDPVDLGAEEDFDVWEIIPPDPEDPESHWQIYVTLADELPGPRYETELEALDVAEAELRKADPDLHARLIFDMESSGTGIYADDPADLERVRDILRGPA